MSRNKQGRRDTMDPRARRTRRLLLDGLKELMLERSYGRITAGDIAAQATVNRATLYLHFRDKDALLQELLEEHVREGLDRSAPVPSSREADYLPVLLTAVCELLARITGACPRSHKQFEAHLEALVQADVRARIAAWLALPGAAPEPGAEPLAATVLSAALFAAAQAWQRDERRPSAQIFARRAIPVLMAPLGGSDGTVLSARRQLRVEPAGRVRSGTR
jgi:AcrR family transcriptional regulator